MFKKIDIIRNVLDINDVGENISVLAGLLKSVGSKSREFDAEEILISEIDYLAELIDEVGTSLREFPGFEKFSGIRK